MNSPPPQGCSWKKEQAFRRFSSGAITSFPRKVIARSSFARQRRICFDNWQRERDKRSNGGKKKRPRSFSVVLLSISSSPLSLLLLTHYLRYLSMNAVARLYPSA